MLSAISSFSVWDWLQVVGTIMVLLGVAGELVAEFKRFPFNPTRFPPLESLKRRIEITSLIVLILGLLLEVVALPHSIVEAGNARKIASEANERASTNEVHFAELTRSNLLLSATIEELRSNNIAIEEQMKPRDIEEYAPSVALRKFAGVNAVIICAACPDCSETASKIGTILGVGLSNWHVEPAVLTAKEVDFGVHVSKWFTNQPSSEEYNKVSDACAALADELNKGGIDALMENSSRGTTIKFNGVLIVVGEKPTPAEAELIKAKNDLQKSENELRNPNISPQDVMQIQNKESAIYRRISDAYSKIYVETPEDRTPGVHMHDTQVNPLPLP